ncbi:hypothetical protein [Rubrivirga marina]|uniref:Type 1 periplasmic binding fold superfamily protein n=1 Tax=Rubrivirga marina TaxID=1196024 RepID=A0A271IXE4_9BACT|nr:hypothetical protein [Rubrivirga marina]PAP75790.1 hypothetical protein BSZ37_04710 [Rubrivirga marina]
MVTHNTTRALGALALLGALSLTACDSGAPDGNAGEEELITQVTLSLTPTSSTASPVTIQANFDADGTNPTFTPTALALEPGTTYNGSIQLRDTFNDDDITEEIEEESEEHLFRYALSPASLGTVTVTDSESDYTSEDENGGDYAVGLTFQVTTAAGASGTGTMNVLLYHFDEGPKTSSTATSDEIDVDVAFPVSF